MKCKNCNEDMYQLDPWKHRKFSVVLNAVTWLKVKSIRELKKALLKQQLEVTKLNKLLEIEGITEDELARTAVFDSIVTGICRNADCEYTTGVEPDQARGWCEECSTNTVESGGILLGLC